MGPMLKSLHRGTKGGGPDPLDPPPGSATGSGPEFFKGGGVGSRSAGIFI